MLTFRFAGKPFRRAEHREQGDTHKVRPRLRCRGQWKRVELERPCFRLVSVSGMGSLTR